MIQRTAGDRRICAGQCARPGWGLTMHRVTRCGGSVTKKPTAVLSMRWGSRARAGAGHRAAGNGRDKSLKKHMVFKLYPSCTMSRWIA